MPNEGPRERRKKNPRGVDGQPLVVQQFAGAGRSMFLGFDETWRWNCREDQANFNQFWIQTMRYLAQPTGHASNCGWTARPPIERGEPIKMTVRFPDDAPPPRTGNRGQGDGRTPQPGEARRHARCEHVRTVRRSRAAARPTRRC